MAYVLRRRLTVGSSTVDPQAYVEYVISESYMDARVESVDGRLAEDRFYQRYVSRIAFWLQ